MVNGVFFQLNIYLKLVFDGNAWDISSILKVLNMKSGVMEILTIVKAIFQK